MSKLKKVLLMCTAYVLVAALAIGGTIAYLQDSDSDVNVMTLGNVSIAQHEYERVVNADGTYATDTIDGMTSYVLKDFTQGKPLLPATDPSNHGAGTWDSTTVRMSQVDSYGGMQVFVNPNAQDKFVTVENTGKTDAYVRTLVAIENGTGDASLIGIGSRCVPAADAANSTAPWVSNYIGQIKVDDNTYGLYEYVYRGASDVNRHVNGVLPAGETTYPSLCQVYLKSKATNEDMEKIDGNGNGTLDILVLSQAVQTAGFADAKTALDTAFGKSSEKAAEWFGGITVPTGAGYNGSFVPAPEGAVPVNGTDKAAVLAAIEAAQPGDVVALTKDTTIAGYAADKKLIINKNITLDLNGKTLTTECGWGGIDLKNGASIVNGTINHTGNTAAIKAFQVGKIENVVINVTETAGKTKGGIVVQEGAGCYVGSIKNVTINGATNGIETYRCGERTDLAIGSMENVTINAIDTGISLSAPIGEVKNCTIKGAKIGVNAYLYGPYSVTADFINCVIEGADADIYAHDEVGKTNPGSMTVTYDSVMALGLNVVSEIEAEAAGRVFIGIK